MLESLENNVDNLANFVNNLNCISQQPRAYVYSQSDSYVATLRDYKWLIPVNDRSFYYITTDNKLKDNNGQIVPFIDTIEYGVADLNLNIYYTSYGCDLSVYMTKSNSYREIDNYNSDIINIEPLPNGLWVQTINCDYLYDSSYTLIDSQEHDLCTIRVYYPYDTDIYAEYNYETGELVEYNTQCVIACYSNVVTFYYDQEGNLIVSTDDNVIFQDIFLKVSKQPLNR